MTGRPTGGDTNDDIETYRLHVSQKWLDATEAKLRIARLPREIPSSQAGGVNLSDLEPLLDFWQETYDFRAQEQTYNSRLPQFRVRLKLPERNGATPKQEQLRLHYVHRRSTHENAIPLLFCHSWGSTFIEPARIVESLCEPVTTPPLGNLGIQAFHVVCPSIPGFGFSDMSEDGDFGLQDTAEVFKALMEKLGYNRYIVCGSQWGFKIGMKIAQSYPYNCLGVYTTNPETPEPHIQHAPFAWLKYRIARLSRGHISFLSFGYTPADFTILPAQDNGPSREFQIDSSRVLDYALTDSPTGLLAFLFNFIKAKVTYPSMAVTVSNSVQSIDTLTYPWQPSDILTWTMLYWLPGPEAPFRWLQTSISETSLSSMFWKSYTRVPLGVSHFKPGLGTRGIPPLWTGAYLDLKWLRRHDISTRWPAWEVPEQFVLDLRDFVSSLKDRSLLEINDSDAVE